MDGCHTYDANWQGIPLSVRYWPEMFSSYRQVYGTALSRVVVAGACGHPLPDHGIGWVRADILEEWGGPLPYVLGLLDLAAQEPAWMVLKEQARQFSLF